MFVPIYIFSIFSCFHAQSNSSQYTLPKYGTIDLKYMICPSCDKAPELTIREALSAAWVTVKETVSNFTARSQQVVASAKQRIARVKEKTWDLHADKFLGFVPFFNSENGQRRLESGPQEGVD